MPATTYTVLVTVAHSASVPPSTSMLEAMIERGLEEGVREMAGLEAVTASAIVGDAVRFPQNDADPAKAAKKLHKAMRA